MNKLLSFTLALWSTLCVAQGYSPGPTLTATTPYSAASSPPSKGILFVDGVEQPPGACRVRKLSDGASCIDCDLSSLAKPGNYSLQMSVEDSAGTRSAKSVALSVTVEKSLCGKPDASGTVRCQVGIKQPTPLGTGACATAFDPKWLTPTAGTGTTYSVSNGALKGIVSGKKAPASAECDCSTSIQVGTSTYCPLLGGPKTEATLCQKR